MSEIVPAGPYIYQPGAVRGKGASQQRIYALAGPGTDLLSGRRFTKEEAEDMLAHLILQKVGLADAFLQQRNSITIERKSKEEVK